MRARRDRWPHGGAWRVGCVLALLATVVVRCDLGAAAGSINFRSQTRAVFYNDVWSSFDGVNWTKHAAPPWTSGPCNKGPLDRGIIMGSVVFQGRLWVLGGGSYATTNPDCGNVGSSEVWSWDGVDGHAWVEATVAAPWTPRIYHGVFVFDNQMWVMAGVHNDRGGAEMLCDVWSSPDGVNWTAVANPAPWSGRHAPSVWVYDDAVYMEGGTGQSRARGPCPNGAGSDLPLNDVWRYAQHPGGRIGPPEYSWRPLLQQGEAPFPGHDAAGALVYKNLMWLIGGWNPEVYAPMTTTNEVWNSADGIHWTQVKRNTFVPGSFDPLTDWEGRHTAGWVVFDDKMWIVGGDNNSGHYQSDIWNSSDGAHWTKVTDSPQWALRAAGGGPRVMHYTVAFNNGGGSQIYVIGGQTLPETIGYNIHAVIDTLLLH